MKIEKAKGNEKQMTNGDRLVVVVDDDAAILNSLEALLSSRGYEVRLHPNAEAFFEAGLPSVPACLLLDVQLGSGATGIQLHRELGDRGWEIPTVFLTAHWNVQSVVKAMREGADGFLAKPYDPMELLNAVEQALQRAEIKHQDIQRIAAARSKASNLTKREREIVSMVLKGMLNKQIAGHLGLALVTVKVHRGRAMQKLGAGTPAELGRIAAMAGIEPHAN